jgi:phosphohistidine phosphatase
MKKLVLLRHGKAEPESPGGDRDRALAERGQLAAAAAAQNIRQVLGVPDAAISSPARRARQTAQIVCAALECLDRLTFDEALYGADFPALLSVIRKAANEWGSLLIVGHNPGLEDAVGALVDRSSRSVALPTAAVAYLDLPISKWKDAEPECGKLKSLWTPRNGA